MMNKRETTQWNMMKNRETQMNNYEKERKNNEKWWKRAEKTMNNDEKYWEKIRKHDET